MKESIYYLSESGVFEITPEMIPSVQEDEVYDISEVQGEKCIKLSDEQLLFFKLHRGEGLSHVQIYNMEPNTLEERKDKVSKKRESLYKSVTDPLYIAYVKYTTLGEVEKAEAKHQEWLDKLQEIKDNNPYPTE